MGATCCVGEREVQTGPLTFKKRKRELFASKCIMLGWNNFGLPLWPCQAVWIRDCEWDSATLHEWDCDWRGVWWHRVQHLPGYAWEVVLGLLVSICGSISNVPLRYKSQKSVNCWEVLTGRLLFQGSQGPPCHQTKHARSVVMNKQPRWTAESGRCQMGFLDIFSLWCDSEVCIFTRI